MTKSEQLTLALKRNRGGKGQGPSPRETKLAKALGLSVHVVIQTAKSKPYPRHYTIDCACVRRGIAIEVDGPSHRVLAVQAADRRKTRLLRSYGWHVFRVTNDDIDKRFEATVRRLQERIRKVQCE
jgi:very-short-patch-repair endonuclease